MGESKDLGELAKKLGTIAAALDVSAFFVETHKDIAKAGKAAATRHGGAMRVWSKGKASHRGVKLGAWDQTDATSTRIKPRQPGLWAITEDGARGHAEPRTRTKTGRKRKGTGKVLTIPGAPRGHAASAEHPGRGGHHKWTMVREDVTREAPPIVDAHVRNALARVFGAGRG